MRLRFSLRLAALSAALLIPAAATAQMAGVRGITATLVDGKATVRWQAATGDVAQYRVYHSHASILQNGGKYDDFETAPGTATEYTFSSNPPVPTLYLSVLAVDRQGNESPYFLEEVALNLSQGGSPQAPSPMPASTGAQGATLRLLTVRAISATGVTLNFSQAVVVDQAAAMSAFDISDASGAKLQLRRLVLDGKTVTIHTQPQVRNRIYVVRVGAGVSGRTEDKRVAPLDPQQPPVLFAGSPDGVAPGSVPSVPQQTSGAQTGGGPRDVSSMRLTGIPDGQGTYTIEASWVNPAGIVGLRVAQTADQGATFWPEQQLAADTQMLRVRNVPGGTFGIRVRAVGTDNSVSPGVYTTIDLPKTASRTPKPTVPDRSTGLPNSGVGLAAAVILAGAGAGYREMRRRRA